MSTAESPRLNNLRRAVFLLLCLWFAILVVGANLVLAKLQAASDPGLPFGISSAHGAVYAQDFSYNMLYFHGIKDRLVPRPYRLEDQEAMMRQILPGITSGMSHAYSPVAFVLVQPLLLVSGQKAYLIYTILCGLSALALYYFYLLPRVEVPVQFYALTICAICVWVVTIFAVGQSPIITTALLGGFWALLTARPTQCTVARDLAIAVLFWALCLKPSVAILPALLLLGSKAWRPLSLGAALLLITWTALANFYGGWWTGLNDYLYLLNHYHNADFTPFMQRFSQSDDSKRFSAFLFSLDRGAIFFLGIALIILVWTKRITPSEQFQGTIWLFLLFSPYLLPSENWVLCLLVVEGVFFRKQNSVFSYAKLFLLMAIFDLRAQVTFPIQVDYPLKCILFTWMFAEWLWDKRPELRAVSAPT
ncbi:MAG: hypothetical protein LV479_05695 [Methylacidiphilales bacterium]|nr:hypothetical protein [Candidatus Methylacidiphilales bacterium]